MMGDISGMEQTCELSNGFQKDSFSKDGKDKDETSLTFKDILCIIHLCWTNFSVGVFFGMMGPFFPQEAAAKGMGPFLIGMAFSSYQLVVILMSPVYGAHLSRLGPKRTYACGLMLTSTSTIVFGTLYFCRGVLFTVLSILIRTIQGLGAAAYMTSSYSILGTLFPKRVSVMIAFIEASSALGQMVGPPIGGILYQVGGFILPFVSIGICNFIWALLSLAVLPSEALAAVSNQTKSSLMRPLLKMPVILMMVFSLITGFSTITFLDVGFALRLKELYNFTPLKIGLVFLVGPAVYSIAAVIWGLVADRKPHLSLVFSAVGFILAAIAFLLLGPAPFLQIPERQLWLTIVALTVGATGLATFVVTFQVMSTTAVRNGLPHTSETLGAVSGIIASSCSFGSFTGPLLGGYLLQTIKFAWTAFVFGCIALCYGVLATIYLLVTSPCTTEAQQEEQELKKPTEKQRLVTK